MDPTGLAIAFAVFFCGAAVIVWREAQSWPEWAGRMAALGVLAPVAFWALSSGWVWAFVAAAVIGWVAWCAVRLVCALLA